MYLQRKSVNRRILANDNGGMTNVEPEASELLFEAEDVAQLVAEVTGSDVAVTTDEEANQVTFEVDGDSYTVEPEENVEILEATRAPFGGKRAVKASTRRPAGKRRIIRR